MDSTSRLTRLWPAQIVMRLHAQVPRQIQRWIVRGDPCEYLGVYTYQHNRWCYIRLKPKGRAAMYFMLQQPTPSQTVYAVAPGPPDWSTYDVPSGRLLSARKREALIRLKFFIRRKQTL